MKLAVMPNNEVQGVGVRKKARDSWRGQRKRKNSLWHLLGKAKAIKKANVRVDIDDIGKKLKDTFSADLGKN